MKRTILTGVVIVAALVAMFVVMTIDIPSPEQAFQGKDATASPHGLIATSSAARAVTGTGLGVTRAGGAFSCRTLTSSNCVFDDEFGVNGPPNPAIWNAFSDWQPQNGVDAGNCVLGSASVVDGGMLVMSSYAGDAAAACPVHWDAGGNGYVPNQGQVIPFIQTNFSFLYGTMEIRLQVPSGHGPWPAMASYGTSCQGSGAGGNFISAFYRGTPYGDGTGPCAWPLCGEIDTEEQQFSQSPRSNLDQAIHYTNCDSNTSAFFTSTAWDQSASLTTFGAVWTPFSVSFYICHNDPQTDDAGSCYPTASIEAGAGGNVTLGCNTGGYPPNVAEFITFGFQQGGQGGTVNNPNATEYVDYVRVTQP